MSRVREDWIEREFKTIDLGSRRLEGRLKKAVKDLSEQPSKSIFLSSGSRAQAKAVYRMLGNEKMTADGVLSAHRDAIGERIEGEAMLAIQDTMAVNMSGHEKTEGMGYNCEQSLGVNVHTCLLVSETGIPQGVIAQSVSTRSEPKKSGTRKEKSKRTIEEKESYRWLETMQTAAERAPRGVELIHVADREGDIYELYAQAERTSETFVIRVMHDRLDTCNAHIEEQIRKSAPIGEIKLVIPENHAKKTKEREAVFTVRSRIFDIKRPQNLSTNEDIPPSLALNLICVTEESPPTGMASIEWLMMTNLPIATPEDVLRVVNIYRNRWKIERFHYVLKSGCQIEKLQQRSVNGITMMILLYSIISIHIMILTYLSRCAPDTPCDMLFSEIEWRTLYRAANQTRISPEKPYSIVDAARYVAMLGGSRGAPSDGPPGLKAIWLGFVALHTLCAYREWI